MRFFWSFQHISWSSSSNCKLHLLKKMRLLLLFFTYIFLSEIDEVLEVDVVSVRPDVIVDEQVELILNPILKDKRQDARRQLQKEDDSQEHRELQREDRIWCTLNLFARHCSVQSGGLIMEHTNLSRNVFSRSAPIHPAKPRMNMTAPTTMNSQTGSRPPRSVMDEMLDRTPWREETEDNNTLSLRWAAASLSGHNTPEGSQWLQIGWSVNELRGGLRLLQPQNTQWI